MVARADGSSPDMVLRGLAPPMIAFAYQRARSGAGDARDRLGRRLGLVDAVLRYLVAVLASEHAGLGLSVPTEYATLLGKLDHASLGDWSKAAEALARQIAESSKIPVARELVEILCVAKGRGRPKRTNAAAQLEHLVNRRNRVVHQDGTVVPNEHEAARILGELEEPLRVIIEALQVVRLYPLLYLECAKEQIDGSRPGKVLRFLGTDVDPVTIDGRDVRVPVEIPFILSPNGDALLLYPFVRVEYFGTSTEPSARLLLRWDPARHMLLYSAPDGGEPLSAPPRHEQTEASPPSWARRQPDIVRRANAVPRALHAALLRASELAPASPVDHTTPCEGTRAAEIDASRDDVDALSVNPTDGPSAPDAAASAGWLTVRVVPAVAAVSVRVHGAAPSRDLLASAETRGDGSTSRVQVPAQPVTVVATAEQSRDGQSTRVVVTSRIVELGPDAHRTVVLELPTSARYPEAHLHVLTAMYDSLAWLRRRAGVVAMAAAVAGTLGLVVALLRGRFAEAPPGMLYVRPIDYRSGLGHAGAPKDSRAAKVLRILSTHAQHAGVNTTKLAEAAFLNDPHTVRLPEFYLDIHEVTVEDYASYLRTLPDGAPRTRAPGGPGEIKDWDRKRAEPGAWKLQLADDQLGDQHRGLPVHSVTWAQADRYCRDHGGSLPSSDQWEVAARNLNPRDELDDGTLYPWGDEFIADIAQTEENHEGKVVPVCKKADRTRNHSICDLGGNLREWTVDPAKREGYRWLRGTSFGDSGEVGSLGYIKYISWSETKPDRDTGFRCAYVTKPPGAHAAQIQAGSYRLGRPVDPVFDHLSKFGDIAEFLLSEEQAERVGDFFIQARKVTMGEYREFLRTTERGHGSWCRETQEPLGYDHSVPDSNSKEDPVLGVSWHDAHAYCAHRGMRLPTANEWERIVRGERGGILAWGDATKDQAVMKRELAAFSDKPKDSVHALVRGMWTDGPEWTNTKGWKAHDETRVLKGMFPSVGKGDPSMYVSTMRFPASLSKDKIESAGFRCVLDRSPNLAERVFGTSTRMTERSVEWPPPSKTN